MNATLLHQPRTSKSRRTRRLPGLLFMATLSGAVLSACGGDGDPLGPDDPDVLALSDVEASQMFSALVNAYALAPTIPGASSRRAPDAGGGASAAVPVVNVTVDTVTATGSCPAGGSVTAVTIDSIRTVEDTRSNPTPDTAHVVNATFGGQIASTTTYQNCASVDAVGGTWTFDASPGLNLRFDLSGAVNSVVLTSGVAVQSWNWSWDGAWTGSLLWSHAGRSGRCDVNVQWIASSSFGANGQATTSSRQSGTLCGYDVSAGT